jgi:hypothetical protein
MLAAILACHLCVSDAERKKSDYSKRAVCGRAMLDDGDTSGRSNAKPWSELVKTSTGLRIPEIVAADSWRE